MSGGSMRTLPRLDDPRTLSDCGLVLRPVWTLVLFFGWLKDAAPGAVLRLGLLMSAAVTSACSGGSSKDGAGERGDWTTGSSAVHLSVAAPA